MGWMDEIGPKTADFLKEFGPQFLKCYGLALLMKIKAEVDAEQADGKADSRMLMYRDWNPVKSKESSSAPAAMMESDCWIREGAGEGAFSGWAACYLVQLPDSNLAVYRSAKDAALKDPKKARTVIRTAGYRLVREVTTHYDSQAKAACEELECEKPDIGYSMHSWALVHGMRTNYIFQLHKGVGGGGCACLGGGKVEPADAGAENAEQAEKWAGVMEKCTTNSSPRKLDSSVVALAFERTAQKMSLNLPALSGFSDDGTEGQILAHMIFLAVFEAACKSDAQEQLKQAPIGRLGLWFRARGSAAAIIEKAVDASWGALQKQAEEQTERLAGKIKPLLAAVLQKKAELQDMLRTQVGERIGQTLSQLLGPILKELTAGLRLPFTRGIAAVTTLYQNEMQTLCGGKSLTGALPANVTSALDKLPRDAEKLKALDEPANALLTHLAQFKQSQVGAAFTCLKPREVEAKFRQALAQLLDAMVHTTQANAAAGARETESDVVPDVLTKAKVDALSLQKEFVSGFFVGLLLGQLKERTREFVEPAIQSAQSVIPEELHEIIDLDAEYNLLLEITIGAAIGKAFEPQ